VGAPCREHSPASVSGEGSHEKTHSPITPDLDFIRSGAGCLWRGGGSSRPTVTGSLATFDGEYIRGSYHAESVTGTSRNDIIIDFAGPPDPNNPNNNFIHAGEGNDVVYSGGQTFAGDGVDLILGTSDVEWVYGEGGNDLIAGQGGDDWLSGGSGNDIIVGGAIIDESIFSQQISIANVIQSETIWADNPVVNFLDSDIGLAKNYREVTLDLQPRSGQTIAIGGQGDDLIIAHTQPPGGTRTTNQLFGDEAEPSPDGGNDILIGSPFVDVMTGGRGDDIFFVLQGGDTDIITDFGLGNDRIGLVSESTVSTLDDIKNLFSSFDVYLRSGDTPYTEIQVSIFNEANSQNEIVVLVMENFTHPLAFADFEVFTQAEFNVLLTDAEDAILNEFA